MNSLANLVTAALVFLASAIASAAALELLRRSGVFDRPNERSSHRSAVPRGGGIGFIAVTLIVLTIFRTQRLSAVGIGVIAGAVVIAVSFVDDLRSVSLWMRLAGQLVAIAAGL